MKNLDVKELTKSESEKIDGGLTVVVYGSFVIAVAVYSIWGRRK
jgi:hypothetical protein